MTPKATIVVPSLNTARYVREALESVAAQTLRDIEVICVDAGSTDGTREIEAEFAKGDRRFRLIDSPVKSYGAQMNIGFAAARGEYVGIVEPDDWAEPGMFAALAAEADGGGLDFVKSDVVEFAGSGRSAWERRVKVLRDCPGLYGKVVDAARSPKIVHSPILATWTGLYRRSFLGGIGFRYNETPGASYQDTALYVASLAAARRCKFLPRAWYHYRRDNASSSSLRKDGALILRREYEYIRKTCLAAVEPQRLAVLKPHFLAFQFAGEVFTARRLPESERAGFWAGFRGDFAELYGAGAFRRDAMPVGHWLLLRRVMEGDGAVGLAERLRACLAENGLWYTIRHAVRRAFRRAGEVPVAEGGAR